MRTISQIGINLIKSFEGCSLTSYKDIGGTWTIGYGSVPAEPRQVISQEEADARLLEDIQTKAEIPVNNLLTVDLNQNQFDAICSLCYNIGSGNFGKSSTLALINESNFDAVPAHILLWDKVNGAESAGLLRRRQAEVVLWGTPDNVGYSQNDSAST